MNVLVLSAGTRNKIIRFFRETLKGKGRVIATDCNKFAPAIYEADAYYLVPRIDEPDYLDVLTNICSAEKIDGVLSLIDPELEFLARNQNVFTEKGVAVIGSPLDAVKMSFDKFEFYKFCTEHSFNTIESFKDLDTFYDAISMGKIAFPVFIKPRCGSCSLNIQKVYDRGALEYAFRQYDNLLIQELVEGQEIGADVYIDSISGKVVSIFTKKKILMRAGETDKSVSFKDEKLFDMIEKFVIEAGYRFNIDIDIFERNGEYLFSEVNPRFGGGYPHAFECGCNFMQLIINNLQGKENIRDIGGYDDGIVMMKYLDTKYLKL